MTSLIGNNGYRGNSTGVDSRNAMTGGGSVIPKGYKQARIEQYTPEQHQLMQDMYQQLGPESFLRQIAGGDEGAFNQLEAPALKQFSGLQGQLASRFSGMGLGGRRSSGFQNTANQASSDFAQQLQSNRQGLMRQALQDMMGYSGMLLGQRPYENMLVKKPQNWLQKLLQGVAGGAVGAGVGYATGGPTGAILGGSSGFGNAYGGQ